MRAAEVACRPKRPLGRAHGDHLRAAVGRNRRNAPKRPPLWAVIHAVSMRSLQRHNQRPQPNAVTTFHRYINDMRSNRSAAQIAGRIAWGCRFCHK